MGCLTANTQIEELSGRASEPLRGAQAAVGVPSPDGLAISPAATRTVRIYFALAVKVQYRLWSL